MIGQGIEPMETSSAIVISLSLALAIAVAIAAAADPCDFSAVFNFGDSNSDTDGHAAAFGQPSLPYGETSSFFRRPASRFSDGRLVVDFITEMLGLPHLSAFLDALGSNFTHGANFATAGSTISPAYSTVNFPFSLNIQLYQFHDFQSRCKLIRSQGLLPTKKDIIRGLYTFDIGQNDLAHLLYMTTQQVKAHVLDLLDQFKAHVKGIYVVGGRSFWIHNTGPLGCLPYNLERYKNRTTEVDEVGCIAPFNEVAIYFNLRLKEAVVQLRKDLPSAALTYVDVYSVKYDIIAHAKDYGFKQPLRACCGHGGKYNARILCGIKQNVKGKQILAAKSCKVLSLAISWDGVHYTEAANKWVFDHINDGSYSDPPIPLTRACHRTIF